MQGHCQEGSVGHTMIDVAWTSAGGEEKTPVGGWIPPSWVQNIVTLLFLRLINQRGKIAAALKP